MSQRIALAVGSFLLAITPLWAQTTTQEENLSSVSPDINKRFLDPELDVQKWLGRFEVESREIFANRKAIVEAIQIAPGTRLADVGSGTGVFTEPFSKAVTETGKIYALDISPRFIEHLKQRVQEKQLKNVEVLLSKEDSTELPNGSADIVFVCDTYHHFENYVDILHSIRDTLRPGGQLVVIDFERIPGKSREWVLGHVRAGKERSKQEILQAGFQFQEEVKIPGLLENYFLRFKKP